MSCPLVPLGAVRKPIRFRQALDALGIAPERVQCLAARALRKLRDPELVRQLEELMDR